MADNQIGGNDPVQTFIEAHDFIQHVGREKLNPAVCVVWRGRHAQVTLRVCQNCRAKISAGDQNRADNVNHKNFDSRFDNHIGKQYLKSLNQ